jgi:hypothetical protein
VTRYITLYRLSVPLNERPWASVGPVFSAPGRVFGVTLTLGPWGIAVHRSLHRGIG